MSSATALSGLAHFVLLGVVFMAEAPDVSDSRILDALDERIVSVEPVSVPPVVYFEPEPEPEPVVEEVEEVEVVEVEEEFEPVPTEDTFEREEVEEPQEIAAAPEPTEPEPVEQIEEPTEVAAVPVIDAVPVSADPNSVVAAAPSPSPVTPPTRVVATAEPTEEQGAVPTAPAGPQVDGEAIRRAQERFDRAVRTRLSQLGDAPRRILQSADEAGPFEVEFVAIVDERGRIIELRLVRSSGLPELDEFAESAVQRLRRLARVPDELGDEGRRVPISLVYEA